VPCHGAVSLLEIILASVFICVISSSVDKYLLSVVLCFDQTVFHKCQTKVERSFTFVADFSPTTFSVQGILF